MNHLQMNETDYLSKILIATSDKETEDILLRELNHYDFCITCLSQDKKILLTIMEEDYELAIVDDKLIGIQGHKIIPLMKKIRPNLQIVHLSNGSSNNNHDDVYSSLKIIKPLNSYKILEIAKKISSCLNGYEINN